MSAPEPLEPPAGVLERLEPVLALIAGSPHSLSSVTDPSQARDIHLADSLSGLTIPEIRHAGRVADIGSGAGFPGIPLAVALPHCRFDLVESVGRKARFIDDAITALGLDNARAVHERSEDLAGGDGAGAYDVVTARALAPLPALLELASPLLREGGVLVAWKGLPDEEEESAARRVAPVVAMEFDRTEEVVPFAGSRPRRLCLAHKTGPTPEGFPRRPGMARKRPLRG